MKEFRNLETGLIEVPHNAEVIKQYEKNTALYEEYKEELPKKTTEPTLSELKKQAKELGIEFDNKITKADLQELIATHEE